MAPPREPLRRARSRADWSTSRPRATLMSQAPGFICARRRASMSLSVVLVRGRASTTKSEAASSSGSWSWERMRSRPSGMGSPTIAAVRVAPGGDDRAPKAMASRATARPMEPRPTMPTVTCRQLASRQRLPGALALQLQELGQPAHDGQDHHQRVLGDGLAEDAAGVGDGQAAAGGLRRQQALHAGRGGVHPGQPGAAGQEAVEAGRRHGAAQQHLDVVERAVGEALQRDAHESGSGGSGTDAGQVLLAIARREDGRQRDGGWLGPSWHRWRHGRRHPLRVSRLPA